MDAPKDAELVQAWHMQRALLEKQNIEIARLKKKDKLYAKHKRLLIESNKYFISVIHRLEKEEVWLMCKVLETSQKQYPGLSYDQKIKMLEDDMKRALNGV